MSGFRAVNTELTVDDSHRPLEVTTPTTPRPPGSSVTTSHVPPPQDESSPNTPTRHTFSGISGQRPLPTSSYAEPTQAHPINGPVAAVASISRESSQRSVHSDGSHDVEMDSDDGGDQSDDGSGGDPNKPSKKKKGQRFFCTDFPPCTLSFTRSEHLARHIRKHTGERPFQCHCARRFSRLDNLRQHAQTVHVNEEIPPESLAATGTRFQRQVRTDRVRPAGNRSRSSTLGSQGSVGRSHSRNLSTSSIGSTASSFSQREDTRRRPAPLMMASDPVSRARLTIDTFRDSPDSPGNRDVPYRGYAPESPGGFHTPTSATYSNGAGSPRFSSTLQSPMSQSSRSSGYWGNRTPGRRLSVPSGTSPFQSPSANNFPQPFMSPLASSTSSNFSGSMFTSPTSSTYSSEYQPNATAAREAEYKRRTWHPETNSGLQRRVANPGLHFFNNSSHPSALAHNRPWSQSSQSSETRLPGIESFDQIHNRPSTPPRRGPSPMQIDTPSRQPPPMSPPEQGALGLDGRKGMAEWGMSLHRNLNRLDLASTPPTEQRPPSWHGRPTSSYDNSRPPSWHGPHNTPPVPEHRAQVSFQEPPRPGTAPHAHNPPPFQPVQHGQGQIITQHAQSRPRDPTSPTQLQPETPRKKKRQGWYAGPLTAHAPLQSQIQVAGAGMEDKGAKRRLSPEDSSSSEGVPTPGSTSVGSEWHPNIVGLNGGVNGGGWGESGDQTYTHAVDVAHQRPISESESARPKREGDMLRLEALVAVATSEDKTPQPQKV